MSFWKVNRYSDIRHFSAMCPTALLIQHFDCIVVVWCSVVCGWWHVTVTSFGSSCHVLHICWIASRHPKNSTASHKGRSRDVARRNFGVKASTSFPVAKHGIYSRLEEIFVPVQRTWSNGFELHKQRNLKEVGSKSHPRKRGLHSKSF